MIIGSFLCTFALAVMAVSLLIPTNVLAKTDFTTDGGVRGTISLEIPERGWAGDWAKVRVNLSTEGNAGSAAPLLLRVRLEMVDAETRPEGDVSSTIQPGETSTFSWQLRSAKKAEIKAILWVFVKEQSGDERLLFGREFSYRSLYFGFFAPVAARVVGGFALIIGVVLLAFRSKRTRNV
jgi:hypothetical protein